ncbi:guanylate-binding protein 1-like [Xyrauchen texanus]|uniref:guanylate-binding protein 1-like n=1 Tax=Xyrauchen texanus TaxID=154827 RepID=UPI002241CCC9|nr:guanylate-binding protein 1-like [Xyrauchen texanus]XP_051983653.1 guanylate-binding protein 1-like [Xyrauchen texanus]
MASTKFMSAPVCFIETDGDGLLCVRKEAKDILDSIREPVVVVSIVGLYRTGKSYLMNRLAGQQSGFALGSTIESKTKGIWMWCVPHPSKAGHTLVLLDTEGLGDIDKGDAKHDTWIFCLALLLSSTLVYNSLGVIDSMALEKLHYVTELREHIRVKSVRDNKDDSTQFMNVFPAFVWTVRDFTLELIKDDEPITSDAYLEGALKLKNGSSPQIEQYNLPRRCLQKFFAVRKCFVFPRPAGTKDMRRMEQLTEADLDQEFLQEAKHFCKYIYSCSESKTLMEGRTVSGPVLGSLAEVYVEAIRRGNVPCLENAVVSLAQIHNVQAVDEALQTYRTEILSLIQIPVDPKQLSNIHESAEKKAIAVFMSTSFNDMEHIYQRELAEKIQKEYEDFCVQNKEASVSECQTVLLCVFDPLENALRDGSYLKPGGYRQFRDTLAKLAEEYRSQAHSLIMSEEVLSKYWEEKENSGMIILAADESLTEAQHQQEVASLQKDFLEQKQKGLEEQNQLQHQMLCDMQRTHDENVKQLMERMEKEQERTRQDNVRVMDAKLKEKEALLQQGFQQEASRLQMEINNLRSQRSRGGSSCSIS